MKLKMLFITALCLSAGTASHASQGMARLIATSTATAFSGVAYFNDTKEGLNIKVTVQNAKPGKHAFHIHEFGSCDDMGKAAGSHFNPLMSPHGNILMGDMHKAHMGDFGNFEIKPDGTGKFEAVVPNLSLANGPYTVGGRALIFHEKIDDFSQPVGNAGGRIGCGVIVISPAP